MAIGRRSGAFPEELSGPGDLSDLSALTYVIEQVEPNCNAHAIAEALLEKFDRLCDVMDASPELLMRVDGVTRKTAELLTSAPAIFRQYQESKNRNRQRIWDTATAYQLVRSKFINRKSEIMVLQIVDSRGYLRYMGIVAEGNTHSVPLYMREIMRLCLAYEADAVYISHNHPSGSCTPSAADISVTKEVALALSSIDVGLADHFIFTNEDFLSMREAGALKALRNEIAAIKKQILSARNSDYN